MFDDKVIIVLLRRPRKNKSNESRTDPFWEYGSFGLTGCHRTNLMNPQKLEDLRGVRLAFIQGGHSEMRLVYLTPPIATLEKHENRERTVGEVKWEKVAAAPPTAFAKNYWDALPYQPPCLDQNRAKTYRMLAEFDKYEPTCGEYAYEDRNDSCGC